MIMTPITASSTRTPVEMDSEPTLLRLPAELLQHILAFLDPPDLVQTAKTCRILHTQSYDEQRWQQAVNDQLYIPISTPGPAKSFRELYISHHPNWFLTKKRIWFGDSQASGKLLIARYNEARGCIEAHTVVATRGPVVDELFFWEKDEHVIIHSFEPQISLNLHQPVVELTLDNPKADLEYPGNKSNHSVFSKELLMDVFNEPGLFCSFMLCRSLPESAIGHNTAVWPPLKVPATCRTRNDSRDRFTSTGHRPTRCAEVSQNNFRIRKWVEFIGRRSSPSLSHLGTGTPRGLQSNDSMVIRMPEDIPTYSSLPESCYTPTSQKPWQGIWCGDYSGHGCEFLLITQPDKADEKPLPQGMAHFHEWPQSDRRGSTGSVSSFVSALEELLDFTGTPQQGEETAQVGPSPSNGNPEHAMNQDQFIPSGRLEGIKLTGDPNVPRGEYTFIAPDIGPKGFVRVADEEMFRGARIVRSAGHIAGAGYIHDQYVSSQMILISHDRLAQFWEGFGHISYYQRVDLDALLKVQS